MHCIVWPQITTYDMKKALKTIKVCNSLTVIDLGIYDVLYISLRQNARGVCTLEVINFTLYSNTRNGEMQFGSTTYVPTQIKYFLIVDEKD